MRHVGGRGEYRNAAFAGQVPWHRNFHDVDVCDGNLFKSFTDMQIAPGRGAGLVLQRTYNSNDARIGPFGVGWTHAYDIHIAESGNNFESSTNFFGRADSYHRDADGLYTPPSYKYDTMSSDYEVDLVSGPTVAIDDTDQDLSGNVKHYFPNGAAERDCDTMTDRHGNVTTLAYNYAQTLPDGRSPLQSVTDPSGRSIVFTWSNIGTTANPAYRITQVQGPMINGVAVPCVTYRVTYSYYVSTVTGANQVAIPTGGSVNAADYLYNLASVTLDPDNLNRTTSYTYTDATGSDGQSENGLLASITDPLGHVVSYTYAINYPSSARFYILEGGLGVSSTLTNTAWVYTVTEPAGVDPTSHAARTITWTITGATADLAPGSPPLETYGPEVQVTDTGSTGICLQFLMDSEDRLIGWSNGHPNQSGSIPTGDGTWYINYYDSDNNVIVHRFEGNAEAYIATGDHYQYGSNIGPDIEEDYTYGAIANVLVHSNPGVTPTDTSVYYNANEYFQQSTATDMNGHTTSNGIGASTDPNPGNRGSTLWVRDPKSGMTSYQYNIYGQRIGEINANGVLTTFSYTDAYGNLTQTIQDPGDPLLGHINRTITMTYDASGRVLTSVDPNGKTTTYTYNVLGQTASIATQSTISASAEAINYTYDANGRTATVTDGRGTTVIGYESSSDRVASITDPVTGAISYTYTLTGERLTETLPGGGTWTYQYVSLPWMNLLTPKDNPNNIMLMPASLTDDQGRVTYFNFNDPSGAPLSVVSNVTVGIATTTNSETDYTYDSALTGSHHWISQISTSWKFQSIGSGSATSTLVAQNVYTYDNTGQRLTNQITDNTGNVRTEAYTYDELSRLTNVNYGDGETQAYTFDPMGNRSQMTDTSGSTVTHNYGYDAANRLTSLDSATYTNDANGNTVTGGGRTNGWDSQNRLVSCIDGSNTSTFIYGSDGLRRRATVNGTATDYVLDGQSTVREMQAGVPKATYLTGPNGPFYRRNDTTGLVRWYVYDGLGSVVAEIDPSGNITAYNKYDVYGNLRSRTGTATTSHGFVGSLGHMSEANTGLIYMRARYYDPAIGRFASEDPGKNGSNWYSYAESNPVNNVDANGKMPSWLVDALVGLAIALAGGALLAGALAIAELMVTAGLQIITVGLVILAAIGVVVGIAVFGYYLAEGIIIGAKALGRWAIQELINHPNLIPIMADSGGGLFGDLQKVCLECSLGL